MVKKNKKVKFDEEIVEKKTNMVFKIIKLIMKLFTKQKKQNKL
jgi:hypothetical protein